MKAALARAAADVPMIDLFADAPGFSPKAGAYPLSADASEFSEGSVFICVIDPGIGGNRMLAIVRAHGRIYVGPGNCGKPRQEFKIL